MRAALEATVKLRGENYDHDLTHDLCGGNQSIDFILEIETCAMENCSAERRKRKRIAPTFKIAIIARVSKERGTVIAV